MNNNQLYFSSPKNFKRGKYILNKFRIQDAIIILITIILSIIGLISYLNIFQQENMILNFIMVIIFIIPIIIVYILFAPLPVYFNVYDFLKVFFAFQKKQKVWKWEGIYQFEESEVEKNCEEKK